MDFHGLVQVKGHNGSNSGSSGKFRQREGKPVGRKDEEPSLSIKSYRYLRTRYEKGEIIFSWNRSRSQKRSDHLGGPGPW